jgi:hypothetical protein
LSLIKEDCTDLKVVSITTYFLSHPGFKNTLELFLKTGKRFEKIAPDKLSDVLGKRNLIIFENSSRD